jgi:shikimate dehydrogenase
MKKHLIIGNPIEHSLSPKIHNYWFKKNNIDAIYEKVAPDASEIENIVKDIKQNNLFAMNVTVPFKQQVIPFIEELSPAAKKTNSVNTICKKNGKIYGDNTDIIGFELAIKDKKIDLYNKEALILGAGGVVPSIIVALENLGINKIYLTNRTSKKVEKIKLNFPLIGEVKWGKLENSDIFINATSVGLKTTDQLNINISGIKPNKFFYDVIYNPPMTNFLKKAKSYGHEILNGETMFLYQAQKAFQIWHNITPKIDKDLIEFLNND